MQNHHIFTIFEKFLTSVSYPSIYNSRDFQNFGNIPRIFRINRSRDELNNFNIISLDKVNKNEYKLYGRRWTLRLIICKFSLE